MNTSSSARTIVKAWQEAPWVKAGSAALRKTREKAMERFASRGLPTPAQEAWRNTNLRSAGVANWQTVAAPSQVTLADLRPFILPGESVRMVFVDGHHDPSLSEGTMEGVRSLATTLEEGLAPMAQPAEPMADLNLGFLHDGVSIDVGDADLIHVLWVSTGRSGDGILVHPRTEIKVRGRCRVVESFVGLGSSPAFVNALALAQVAPGAALTHVRIQREGLNDHHIGLLQADLGRDASMSSFAFHVGGGTVRLDGRARLAQGASVDLDGLFLGTGRQSVDMVTRIEHAEPHATSRQIWKGIMDGQARGAYTGTVVVHPGAMGTVAHQTNRNLLLSRTAHVDSTPQLEIHNDDVQCSHGSTIGQLDANALFFLRARGIDEERARLILTQAFAREAIERLPEGPLRRAVDDILQSWFQGRHDLEGAG